MADRSPDADANEQLTEFLKLVLIRGMELAESRTTYVEPFLAKLCWRLEYIARLALEKRDNAKKIRRGLIWLRNLLRMTVLADLPLPRHCHENLKSAAPPIVAFPAADRYRDDHLHLYCASAAALLAFLKTLQDGGDLGTFHTLLSFYKTLTRTELRDKFGSAITRAACINMFPASHADGDYGVVIALADRPHCQRSTLDKSVLMKCYELLGATHPVPPPDSPRGYRKRKGDKCDAERPAKRQRVCDEGGHGFSDSAERAAACTEEPMHSAFRGPVMVTEDGAAGDSFWHAAAAAPAVAVAAPEDDAVSYAWHRGAAYEGNADPPRCRSPSPDFWKALLLEIPIDEWGLGEVHPAAEPRTRGPGDVKHQKALIAVLLACMQRLSRSTREAILDCANDDVSDWSEYSDTDDESDAEEYVCPSKDGGVLRLHLRDAETVSEWQTVNQPVVTFNPLVTDVCATVRNVSRSRNMQAIAVIWARQGWDHLALARNGMLMLKPGESMTMTNTDSSFIISAPEDDTPIEGYFLLFYQLSNSDGDQFNPKWHVAAHAYRLLPEGSSS